MNATVFLIVLALMNPPYVHGLPEEHEGLVARLWINHWNHQYYDPLFVRVTLTNTSDETIAVESHLHLQAEYRITHEPFLYSVEPEWVGGLPKTSPMNPGEEWIVDYEVLQMPPIEMHDHSFWNEIIGKRSSVTATVGNPPSDPTVFVHPPEVFVHKDRNFQSSRFHIRLAKRSDMETEFIEDLYGEMAERVRSRHLGHPELLEEDDFRPTPRAFGLDDFLPYKDLIQQLLDYEEKLSPGSLRDIVHLTRLMRAVYDSVEDEADHAEQIAAVDEVLHYLDTLPQIERENLLLRVIGWWPHFSKNRAYFRLVDGALKRLPKNIYHYDDYAAYKVRDFGHDNPDFLEYVQRHAEEDYKAKPQTKDKTDNGDVFSTASEGDTF